MEAGAGRTASQRYFEGWNDHDLSEVLDQFADDGTYADPITAEPLGRNDLEPYFEDTLRGFPDVQFEYRVIEPAEQHVLVSQWVAVATHTGSYLGLPPTGDSVTIDGVSVFELSEDGIVRLTAYFDQRSIRRQLGLSFPGVLTKVPTLAYGALKGSLHGENAPAD